MTKRKRRLAPILLAGAMAGCRSAEPAAAPVPATAPVMTSSAPPAPPAPRNFDGILPCVVQNGQVRIIPFDSIPHLISGDPAAEREWRERYRNTAEHATGTAWFASHEPIVYDGRRFVQSALPRVLGPDDIVAVGSFRGVTVFVEHDADRVHPEAIYLPVNVSCEFQLYQDTRDVGAVRG